MKFYNSGTLGWKSHQHLNTAVIRKKSQTDFLISVVMAFFIIFIVAQVLGQLDDWIRSPYHNKDLSFLNPLKINSALAAEDETLKLIQSHRQINIVKGVGFTFEVGFKNKTNYTWTQTGKNSVDLKLAPPYTRETVVRHKYWRDAATPAWLKDKEAKPGWLAYYRFALEAPKEAGVYTEKFVLVSYADGHILSGSQFEITMNVWNSSGEFPENQTVKVIPQPLPSPSPSPSKYENLPAQTQLGRMCLDLSVKKFTIASVTQETIDKCKQIGIDLTPNIYYPPTNDVNNNDTPDTDDFDDSNSSIIPSVADGPTMRIGLFYTTDPIIIKASSGFKIKDQNGNTLESVSANQPVNFTYNFTQKTYNFNATSTASYLRLVPDTANGVMEIVSFESRPAWNTSLNDNKFLGILEIRYAAKTSRLWVINELAMENYLKGLAESSNNSPMEYQKALIIAARTYAMHHYQRQTKHADENFILDSKYDQVYKGYGSQIRLTQVSDAVDATKGLVVTYDGKVAITPYFSYSDGRTRSWSEVWGGDVAWCQGVKEPDGYTKTTMYGHGVGMSAYGAILLADDYGYTYEQILKYYFTGIEVENVYKY